MLRCSSLLVPKALLALAVFSSSTLLASFESIPRVFGTASLPRCPIPHDVDGDGDTDLFYVDGSESSGKPAEVGWFQNTGGGKGWTKRVLASGLRYPRSAVVVDLDGDLRSDLVVDTRIGDGVFWFKGLGGGNFAPVANVQASLFSLEGVDAADLNGDGRMDIIISSSSGPRWLRQTTTGFATPAVIANVSGSPENQITKALDFDLDGDIDVVTAIAGTNSVIFSRNNGAGTFASPVSLGTFKRPYALAAADLDSDGLPDVVTGSRDSSDLRVVWLKNLGNGTFSSAKVLDANFRGLNSVTIADLDRDGDPDIAAAGGSGPIVWFKNQGAGIFSAKEILSEGGGAMFDMTRGDMDGDGDMDLVAAQWDEGQFVWYSNTTPPPVIPLPQVVSFTADDTSVAANATLRWQTTGATEISISPMVGPVTASGNRTLALSATTTFTLTARNAGGTTSKTLTVVVGEAPIISSFTAIDETVARGQAADLRWDVAGAQSLNLSPSPGQVTGVSHQPVITATTTFTLRATNEFGESTATVAIVAGDPPTLDSLTANPSSARLNQAVDLVWTARGEDTAFVSEVGEVPVGRSTAVRPASTRNYTVTVSNDFGSASRTVQVTVTDMILSRTLKTLSDSPYGIMDVHFADLNGDGLRDLLQTTYTGFDDATLTWRRAIAGGTTYGPATTLQTSRDRIWVPNAHDMDGDGDLDPLIGGDGPMRWYRNNQNGTSFGPITSLAPEDAFRRPCIGDFNGDGLPDFALEVDSELRFYPGTPGGGLGTPQIIDDFDGSIDFVEFDAADMDRDGDMDLVAGKDFDGEVYWFQNNGGLFTNRFPVYSGGERIIGVTAKDTDGDGYPEVLIQTGGSAFVLRDGNKGNFDAAVNVNIGTGGVGIRDYQMTDLDLDGDLDIAVVGRSVAFIENRGNNVFAVKDQFGVQAFDRDPNAMAVEDVDRDGDPDIVVANDAVVVWLENLYRPAARPTAPDYSPTVSLAEDFGEIVLPLPPLFADADTASSALTYSLRGSEGEQIFSTLSLQNGPPRLVIRSAADLNGQAKATVRATDPTGLYAEIKVDLPVAPVPDAPRRVGTPSAVTAAPAAPPVQLSVAGWFSDPDAGDVLRYTITGNSNPEILASAAVGESDGQLSFAFAPYVSGNTTLEITATDLTGRSVTQEVAVTLPELPPPSLQAIGVITLNRQTGLYELKVNVTNDGARAIGGFRLEVTGLPDGAVLHSKTSDGDVLQYLTPVGIGETVTLVLEYSVPGRSGPGQPVITAYPELPKALTAGSGGFAIDRCEVLEDRSVLIEFTSTPGSRYAIEYTGTDGEWMVSPVIITASANRTQWIDRGPPHTSTHPSQARMRFYRMRQLSESSN